MDRKRKCLTGLFVALLPAIFLSACAQQLAMPPASQVSPLPSPVLAQEAWKGPWDKLITAARRESKIVIFSGIGDEVRIQVPEGFKKRYGLSADWITAPGNQLREKILRERKAGLYNVDIYLGGQEPINVLKPVGALDSMEPALILPEVKDPKNWWDEKLPWVDKDRTMMSLVMHVNPVVAINTSMVKLGEIKSLLDLLEPKWQGKIVMTDPVRLGGGRYFFRFIEGRMGQDFLRQLAASKPMITDDRRLAVEWLSRGKFAIGLGTETTMVLEMQQSGAPIGPVEVKEGAYLTTGQGNVGLVNNAPHPNAARLFINWLLTQEGQTIISRTFIRPSLRKDVPTDHINPVYIRKSGVEYFTASGEEFISKTEEYTRLALEIFQVR